MSWDKICHPHYQRVSEGVSMLPPSKQPYIFLIFKYEKFTKGKTHINN